MLNYLFFLIIGISFGYFINGDYINKAQKIFLNFSIILLLFFMGISIGKDPELYSKISTFGIQAFTIAGFSVFFSIVIVFIIIKAGGSKK